MRRQAVELRRHDEVVLVQILDLFGLQRDRSVAPAEKDVRVVALSLGEFARALDEAERLAEVPEPVGALDFSAIVEQVPVRRLRQVGLDFLKGQRRYAATTRCAALRGKCVGHNAFLDRESAAEARGVFCSASCGTTARRPHVDIP
jgi:hypothetical protein